MTRLRFLATSVLASLAAVMPWRHRFTLEEWCTRNGVTITFEHRPESAECLVAARSTATMMVDGDPRTAFARGASGVSPNKFERMVCAELLGTTHQFHRCEPIDLLCERTVSWDDVDCSNIVPFKRVLVREVHFPSDLTV